MSPYFPLNVWSRNARQTCVEQKSDYGRVDALGMSTVTTSPHSDPAQFLVERFAISRTEAETRIVAAMAAATKYHRSNYAGDVGQAATPKFLVVTGVCYVVFEHTYANLLEAMRSSRNVATYRVECETTAIKVHTTVWPPI